ncbi:MAG: bifunctional riboflavin kinase/FAD synthetase [Clostridia bacterium]|nr:bifunctional riboflavin kinase/FAD synthetase [Clostridia bacterium]
MFQLPEKIKNQGTAVALGYFDGIHLGHKAVLDTALKWAEKENLVPVVMLFDIHPRKLISGDVPPMLLSEEKKKEILTEKGFTVVPFNFREAMDYSPNEFIDRILIDGLNARVVSCGFDYHYGKGGRGDAKSLGDELERRGVKLFAEEAVLVDGEVVSSTTIRELISNGEIQKANTMLGYCFSYDFTVKKGDGLGRVLGFPTINQGFPEDFIVPRYGVYASKVLLDNKWYPAVTNVGVRPTVANSSMRSETCIFDFSGDLYGKNVEVSLLRFIRDEIKFPDIDALSAQIEKDIVTARNVYDEVSKNG